MKNQRDTSLRIRLASITILALLITLAMAAYLSGRQVQSDSELISEDAVPGTINAHYMRMAISRSIGWVLVAASAQSAQFRDTSLKTVHDADTEFAETLKQYETTIQMNPAKDRMLLEQVKSRYAEFYRQRMAYEGLILAGDREGAAAFLERELLPAFIPAINSAEEMIEYNHGNSIALSRLIHSSVHYLYLAVAVVMVLTLACGVVLVFNLTIRRRELAELQEKEEKFSKAFQANPIGISITEIETGRYIEVNDSFCRILGYPLQEVIGYTTLDKGIWNSAEEGSRILQPLLTGGALHHQEIQIRTRYGVRKTVSLNAELIELRGIRCLMTLIEDITERRCLEQKQQELAAIVESSEDAIIGKTLSGIIKSWNRGAEKIFGYTAAEAIGQPLLILIPPERQHEETEILASIARGETVQHFERVRVRKDGREIFISATISPLKDGNGRVIGASKIARDITAQKQADEALRESEERIRILGDNLPNGMMYQLDMGADGQERRFTYVSAGVQKLHEVTAEATMQDAQVLYGQIVESDRPLVAAREADALANMTPFVAELRMRLPTGAIRWSLVASAPRRTANGHVLWDGIELDITERKRAMEQLEMLKTSIDQHFDAAYWMDTDNQFVYVNDTGCKALGYTREELLGKPVTMVAPNASPLILEEVWKCLRETGFFTCEGIHRRKDGSEFPVEIVASYVRFEGKEFNCGFARDITERKRTEDALASSEKLLRQLIKHTPAAVAMFDTEMRYLQASDRWITDYHLEGKDVIGRSHYEVFPDLPEHWKEIHRRVLLGQTDRCDEAMFERADGGVEWLEWEVRPWHAAENMIGGLIMFTQVITERKRTESKLRESEELFRTSFESATVGVCLVTTDGRFLNVNRTLCAMLGYSENELLQLTFNDVTHDEDKEIGRAFIDNALSGGPRCMWTEKRYLRKDGRVVWAYLSSALIEQARDHGSYLISYVQDITERKRAELRIRHLNRVYEVLSDINKTIVREKNPQAMLEEACRIVVEKGEFRMAWVGMFDAASQKVLPVASAGVVEGYLDLVNIDLNDKERTSGPSGRCFLSGEHVTCGDLEHEPFPAILRAEALKRGYHSSACFPLKAGGKVAGIFSLYSDKAGFFDEEELRLLDELALDIGFALEVSEGESKRRQAEQELRWRTAFFEAQVHSAIDGILVVDSEGKKLLQNRRMSELWKIPPLLADDPDDSKQVEFVLGRVREPKSFAEKIAHLYAHPDESSSDVIEQVDGTIVERYSAPVRGSDGRYYGRVWTFHDITERKKLEQQFLRAQRMEGIGTLASGLAHDLNNILTPIMMSVPLLHLGIPEETREKIIDTIEISAERGAQIVKQVLTFGRGLEGEKLPLHVGMLIHEMEKMIRSTFPKDIAIETVMVPDLWLVLGDGTQLHQVLLNLCVNARDAMPNGGQLRLSAANLNIDASFATMLNESTPGPHVLLEVGDTGNGIPPEIIERIFDPFFTTKEVGKGTGLGLSTVHGIVKSHGGLLKVASEPGKGTTFQVYLPAAPDQEAMADSSSAPPPTGNGELVLVLDDEPAISQAAQTLLEANGYRVLLAEDAVKALDMFTLNSHDIAVVLTDIMMPVMSGVLFLRALREIKQNVPVIASTGLGEKAQIAQLRALGVETVLDKPYNPNTLLRAIHGVLHPYGLPEK